MSLPGLGLALGGRPPPRRLRLRVRPGRDRAAGARHPAPPDHDQGGLRERHRRGHGARRVDQRRAPPPGHRQRGPGRARRSTTSTGSAARVPHIADTKPHGRYHMVDVDRIGGVPVVMRELLEAGLLHGDCLTVTGRTVAENLAALDPPAPDGEVIHPLSDPSTPAAASPCSRGSLAPNGVGGQGGGHRHGPSSRARPGCSTASRGRSTPSWPGPSSPAPWWSSATRGPRAVPACARCWP